MTWIGLYEGGRVDLLHPRPEQFTIEDIARGLSRVNRFAGHTHEPYSVAQHSVIVSRLVPPELALCGLLHDASEAYLGDLVRPLKQRLPGYVELEARMMLAIAERFDFPWPKPVEVREVDNRLLVTERDLLQPKAPAWESLRDVKPYPRVQISYELPARAAGNFLRRYEEIVGDEPGELPSVMNRLTDNPRPFGDGAY
ncbi:hypothetical protein KOR34_02440 [Posidoniimonas corsicana]|uniref:Phosphohydrolase n=1 Tax=Posidoniimonas corsicana TaxID=1938618 RepID=A0A5C5VBJ9_9BACT|nr:phosphohydrolase [Posidoniimonas corsicana]TWT35353.1 hypothetical protein KOR34_02440 [Posidoniimonas corsicana]